VKETANIYQKMITNTSQKDNNQADTSITDLSPKLDPSDHSKNSVKEVV